MASTSICVHAYWHRSEHSHKHVHTLHTDTDTHFKNPQKSSKGADKNGSVVKNTEISRKIQQVSSYHFYPDVGCEGLFSLILGHRERAKSLTPSLPIEPGAYHFPLLQLTREMRLVRVSFRLTLTTSESCSAGRRWGS